ncbi:hypothetical protein BASA62_002449 [Batrachochytrium salamandrivorans]|nr:hypothetical protein BASA62_002449 [Batrachochytrium salamandrivorans]
MIGLQQRNYQFDKLIAEQFPVVARHLDNQDIKSTMYASQWFMTLLHIDSHLICTSPTSTGLCADASVIRLSKTKLDRWSAEFDTMMYKQSPEVMEAEQAKADQRKLTQVYKLLEANYETLNREHVDLANTLLQECAARERHAEQAHDLEQQVRGLKTILASDRRHAEDEVRVEMELLAGRNSELVRANAVLQDDLDNITSQLADAKLRLAQSEAEKDELRKKLDNMRKALGM